MARASTGSPSSALVPGVNPSRTDRGYFNGEEILACEQDGNTWAIYGARAIDIREAQCQCARDRENLRFRLISQFDA
jgi:hypothetical protein